MSRRQQSRRSVLKKRQKAKKWTAGAKKTKAPSVVLVNPPLDTLLTQQLHRLQQKVPSVTNCDNVAADIQYEIYQTAYWGTARAIERGN